jgi:hypothetical protein
MEVYGLTVDPSLQHAAERSPVKMPKPVDLSVLGLRPSECLTVLGHCQSGGDACLKRPNAMPTPGVKDWASSAGSGASSKGAS